MPESTTDPGARRHSGNHKTRLMVATGVIAVVLYFRKRLFDTRWFQYWCMALTPAGFIAVLAGWFVTEIGRQPYIVYGALRTADTVSPVAGPNIALSLLAFIVTYTFVFGAGSYYILRLIGKGPAATEKPYGDHGVKAPPLCMSTLAWSNPLRGSRFQYERMKRVLKARLRAAKAFFLRLTLGFSKYCRLRISERIPARSHCFLKRFSAASKGSFS